MRVFCLQDMAASLALRGIKTFILPITDAAAPMGTHFMLFSLLV